MTLVQFWSIISASRWLSKDILFDHDLSEARERANNLIIPRSTPTTKCRRNTRQNISKAPGLAGTSFATSSSYYNPLHIPGLSLLIIQSHPDMPGKNRNWLRLAARKLCLCFSSKDFASNEEPIPSIVAVSTSTPTVRTDATRNRHNGKPLATPSQWTSDPLTRTYTGAYPPLRKDGCEFPTLPLTSDAVYKRREQQAKIRHASDSRDKWKESEYQTKSRKLSQEASFADTIDEDMPIGLKAQGKQAYLHANGTMELRHKKSMEILNAIQQSTSQKLSSECPVSLKVPWLTHYARTAVTTWLRDANTIAEQGPCCLVHQTSGRNTGANHF